MKKKLTKTICLLSLVSLPTVLALSFVDSEQQNKQEKLQNNRNIDKLVNNNNELVDSNHIIDKPFYILNYAADQKNSIDIYLYGDGYKNNETELRNLYSRAKYTVNYFFNFPQYKQLKNHMNVYLVFTDSKEDGNYSIINKKEDTFFGVYNGWGSILDIDEYGKEKIKTLDYQLKNRITRQGDNHFSRANIYLDTYEYGGVSLRQFSITGGMDSDYAFAHEMTHNFNLDDEYIRGVRPEANPSSPNTTPYNDPNKVQWREFLGYRNIGIYRPYGAGKKFLLPYVSKGIDVLSDACIMKTRESKFFCEVCRWKSFQFINDTFKNKLDYIGFPSITTSYNSGDYQKNREELVDEKGQHNTNEIKNNQNKHIDLRTVFYNVKEKPQEIKLKLTIRDKTTKAENITEETFLIQSNQIKQLRLTSKDKLNSTNVELIGEIIDATTSKVLATSQNYWREPKKLIVNFLDNNTNKKIDYIDTQTYFYDNSNSDFVNVFQGQDLVGYRFKSKTMKKNGNDTILDLKYEPLKYKEITMNLYDSVNFEIIQTKKWKIFEGETFAPSKYDFLLPSDIISNSEIVFPKDTISYATSGDISLNYVLKYKEINFKIKETKKTIKLGDDKFDIYSNAIVETKKNNQWVENKYLSSRIIVDDNGFNPYKVGSYNIEYKNGKFTQIATIVVENNSSISQEEKEFISAIANMTNKPIVANSNVDISKIDKNNIQSYVDNWPQSSGSVNVTLEKFEPIVENASIRLTFKFTSGSLEKKFKTTAKGFSSVEKEFNDVFEWAENVALSKVKVNDKGRKTHINKVTSENIKEYVDNWPQKDGYTFDGIVENKVAGTLVLCIKVTKNDTNISKITSGMWKGDFLFEEGEETENPNPEYPDKFKTLSDEIKKINDSNLKANDKGSELMANQITIENLQQNIANFPTIDSSVDVSIDFLAISNQEQGGDILVKYKLTLNENNGDLVLYSNFKEIKGFKPDENILLSPAEILVNQEIKRLEDNPPQVNERGKNTYVKNIKYYAIDDYLTNKPTNDKSLGLGFNTDNKTFWRDEVNGIVEFRWIIFGEKDGTSADKFTRIFRVEGFKKDPNGRPPENNDTYRVELKFESPIYLENRFNGSIQSNNIIGNLFKNDEQIGNQANSYYYEWKINSQLQNSNAYALPINFKKFGNYNVVVEVYENSQKTKLLASNNMNITLNQQNNVDPSIINNFEIIKSQMQQQLNTNTFKVSNTNQINDQWVSSKLNSIFANISSSFQNQYSIVFENKTIQSSNRNISANVHIDTSIYSEENVKSSTFTLNIKYEVDSNNNDLIDIENAINNFNNNPPKINEEGKKTHISLVTKDNISQYLDNWPQNNNGITWTIENFLPDLKNGSIEIILKAKKGNVFGNTNNIKIIGFKFDSGETNPPTKPEDLVTNSSKSLPTWAIVLISISSLVGVGLIGLGIWWFIRKRRYL